MKLIEKQKAKKNLDQVINTNDNFLSYLREMTERLDLDPDDFETLENLKIHLGNVTYLVQKMKEQIR